MAFAKLKSVIFAVLPFLLVAAILLSLIFYPREEREKPRLAVVRLWNIDTFEGGKGSRSSFLKRVAGAVEEKREGVYYLITSYTAEGAEEAIRGGEYPDLISFGVGFSCHAEACLPLPYESRGGTLGGKTLAVPWCRGAYYLFAMENSDTAGETVLSKGGSNLVELAARKSGIAGKTADPLTAYTDLLSGKYKNLLGTQRDVCRFATRGVEVQRRELNAYNDLYQYISVLSAEKREHCLALIDELLSEPVQAWLPDIGMLPLRGDPSLSTVNVFTDKSGLEELRRLAGAGDEKNIDNFLKTV